MVMLREFAESSYKPWAEAVRTIIQDEKIHIAHGARVCRNLAETEEGREQLQAALDRLWPECSSASSGARNTKRSQSVVRYGLRMTTNAEAIQVWREKVLPRIANLGLRIPE